MTRWIVMLVGSTALVVGCGSTTTRVTLLPQPDGSPSAVDVTVKQDNRTIQLSRPYDLAAVHASEVDVKQLTPHVVQQQYGDLLSVQPPAPERFILYFQNGTTELTAESRAVLDKVLARVTNRPDGEILIIGHADRIGAMEVNDMLSLSRAQAVHQMILKRGFAASRVYASSRGEREPLVPNEDEVIQPKNRRVEILVR
jgi:outer membrane protein OmpA-like peptidoglycan-associated protein